MKKYSSKKLNYYRILIQLMSFLFITIIPILIYFSWRKIVGNFYSITIFIFGLEISDPTMVIQQILLNKEIFFTLIISAIIPILIAIIFGKVFCSWVCPYNSLHDLYTFIEQKFTKKKKYKRNSNPTKYIYWIPYLFMLILIILFSFNLFTVISFPGIITNNISYLIIGAGLSIEFLIVFMVFALEKFYSKRFWCKYICPVGATLAIFKFPKTLHISFNNHLCDCKGPISPCNTACPLNLNPKESNLYPYCFNCGKCIKMCEKTGNKAINFTFKAVK